MKHVYKNWRKIMEWIKDRLVERTSLDGVALIAIGGVILLAGPFAKIAAWAAIAYGAWTLIKGE